MNTMTVIFSFLIFVAAAVAVQLPAAAAAGILQQQQQAQHLRFFSSGLARGLQKLPAKKLLQADVSDEEKLLEYVPLGKIPAARRILAQGADPNFQNDSGVSPLILAISSNNAEMVLLLVEFGADIYDFPFKQRSNQNADALHIAAVLGSTKAMAALLKAGAPTDKLDANGLSALHYAVVKGQTAAAKFLLDEGATIDVHSTKLGTPLFMAASTDNLKMVKFLISKGADVESLNTEDGATPLVGGVFVDSAKIVLELIQAGADVNGNGENQETPIYVAAYLGNIGPMKILVENGADLSVQIDGKSLQESLCGCTTDPDAQIACNFIACRERESMEALLE